MDVYEYGNLSADIVLLQPVDGHDLELLEKEIEAIRSSTPEADFMLAAFKVNDWNKDLSPWKAPAVFGKEDFGDGAEETLSEILEYCKAHDNSAASPRTYIIGGYSLAGLFALWSVYQTGMFKGVAAVSPSMWFPGFDSYMEEHEIMCKDVYLSLGNKEEKARNPVMATVGDMIRKAHTLLTDKNINCTLEWNEGNHFRDTDMRTAKGFSWLLEQL